MFQFWGDGSDLSKSLVDSIQVRSTDNFNWTFIFILAVVFYVYWSELHKKNYEVVYAGLALYGVHWLYEICNAVIGHFTGYPLWSVSNESTTYIPFFLASNYVPDMEKSKRNRFLITVWSAVAILLVVLIPLGII